MVSQFRASLRAVNLPTNFFTIAHSRSSLAIIVLTMPTSFPLLTLHPVSDTRHRWVAVLIALADDTSEANPADAIPAHLEHLLGPMGLRTALGKLPCILPSLPLATLTEPLPATIAAGPTLVPLALAATDSADADANTSALAACEAALLQHNPGLHLLARGHVLPAIPTRSVQGCALTWDAQQSLPAPKEQGPHLALAVNDGAAFAAAQAAGWQWMCGTYAEYPTTQGDARGGSARSTMLKLLAQLAHDADNGDIEKTLKQDPNLSYQLLRLVNSVAFALRSPITSFGQALQMLGRRQLQRWLQLLLYAQQGNAPANPLMPIAAWRANLMETLANAMELDATAQDEAFMVGMFSRLDVLLGQPLADIIAPLGLAGEIVEALLHRTGRLGQLLSLIELANVAEAPEKSSGNLATSLANIGLDNAQWAMAQGRSMNWAIQISRES